MSEICAECSAPIGAQTFIRPSDKKVICVHCALKVPPEKWASGNTRKFLAQFKKKGSPEKKDMDKLVEKVADKVKELEPFKGKIADDTLDADLDADLKLCRAHRAKLYLNEKADFSNFDAIMSSGCGSTLCADNCPVPHRQTLKKPTFKTTPRNGGKPVTIDFGEPVSKPKKKKEITKEIQDFLYMQNDVINHLNNNPEKWRTLRKILYEADVWKALACKSKAEILEMFPAPKSVTELVPTHLGGKMDVQPSKETKKMFSELEKQFAEEDEKTGAKPHNFEKEEENVGVGFPARQIFGFTATTPSWNVEGHPPWMSTPNELDKDCVWYEKCTTRQLAPETCKNCTAKRLRNENDQGEAERKYRDSFKKGKQDAK